MRWPPGMIGGPTGFDGAERYQYGADTPEGRADRGDQGDEGRRQRAGQDRARPVGRLDRPADPAFPGRRAVDQGSVGKGDRHPARDRRRPERPGIHQDDAGHLHQGWRLRHLRGRMEPAGRPRRDRRHRQARRLRRRAQAGMGRSGARLCQRRQGRVAAQPVSRLDLWRVARRRLPDLGLPHRPVQRREREEGVRRQARLRARAAQDLEAARRGRGLLPSPGQGPVRLDRPAQPGLGLHQLVPALRVDGLAQPVPVRRFRQAADQLRCRRRRDQRIHRLAGAPFARCDLVGLAGAVRQLRQGRRRDDLRLLEPAEVPRQCRPMPTRR